MFCSICSRLKALQQFEKELLTMEAKTIVDLIFGHITQQRYLDQKYTIRYWRTFIHVERDLIAYQLGL